MTFAELGAQMIDIINKEEAENCSCDKFRPCSELMHSPTKNRLWLLRTISILEIKSQNFVLVSSWDKMRKSVYSLVRYIIERRKLLFLKMTLRGKLKERRNLLIVPMCMRRNTLALSCLNCKRLKKIFSLLTLPVAPRATAACAVAALGASGSVFHLPRALRCHLLTSYNVMVTWKNLRFAFIWQGFLKKFVDFGSKL